MIEKGESNGLLVASEETIAQVKNGEATSNQYVRDLATHAYPLSQLWKICNEIYENINVSTATGEALDTLGQFLDVVRVPSSPAYVDFTVSVSAASLTDIVIPAGTRLLIEEVVPVGDYFTMESITLPAGVTSVTGRAESIDHSYGFIIPAGGVTGLEGFPELSVTNTGDGTHGRNIEEDDDYRQRVMNWVPIHELGTRACLTDFLDHYEGLDSYRLIPMYDGVGTLMIVCDTLEGLLDTIRDDVYRECMVVTDFPPVCVLPEETTLASLTLSITLGSGGSGNLTEEEFVQLVSQQVRVFVEGGVRRNGGNVTGLGIGDDFVPSQLIKYLFSVFPELENVVPSSLEIVTVVDNSKFVLESLEVVVV